MRLAEEEGEEFQLAKASTVPPMLLLSHAHPGRGWRVEGRGWGAGGIALKSTTRPQISGEQNSDSDFRVKFSIIV